MLQAQLLGAVASPVTGLARGLNQLLAGLASQLGQIQDQCLVEGEPEEASNGGSEEEGCGPPLGPEEVHRTPVRRGPSMAAHDDDGDGGLPPADQASRRSVTDPIGWLASSA